MTEQRRSVAAILGLTLIVAACSGGSGTSAAPSAAESAAAPSADASAAPSAAASGAAGDADLVIWADDKRAAALEPLAAQFGEDNGVTVRVEAISADIIPNFLTASEAGTAPDIVVWAHDVVGQLVANSAIDPIQMSDTSGFDPLAIQGMTFDGQLYGIPYSVENIGLFMQHRHGRRLPGHDGGRSSRPARRSSPTATASEVMSLQIGQAGDAYHIYPLFASGGGSFFGLTPEGDPDPENVTVDSEGSIAAGELLKGIGETGSGALKTLDRRHQRHPAVLRQEGAVPGLRTVGRRRHREGRHPVRDLPDPGLGGQGSGRPVHRRQRLLSRQQGPEQGAGPGVRHELPDHR